MPGQAEPECPAHVNPSNPIVTHDSLWRPSNFPEGIDLTFEYWVNPRGVWLKVPYGHLWDWPRGFHARMADKNPDNPIPKGFGEIPRKFSFAFWMPDLRMPERDTGDIPCMQPCEDGRPKPEAHQYIVRARLSWPWLENYKEARLILPDSVRESRLRRYNRKTAYTDEIHGLTRIRPYPTPTGVPGFDFYNTPFGSSPHLELRSASIHAKYPNPLCAGDIWWPDERLMLYLRFSKHNLEDWRKIAEGARTLAHRWRNKAIEDLKEWEQQDGE